MCPTACALLRYVAVEFFTIKNMSRYTQAAVIPSGGLRPVNSDNDRLRRSQRGTTHLGKGRRRRLEIQLASYHRYASLRRGPPWIWFGTHKPIGPRTSIYARIDQFCGTIPAVPTIYDACQPGRRANNDRAALPPFPSVDRIDDSPTIKLLSR